MIPSEKTPLITINLPVYPQIEIVHTTDTINKYSAIGFVVCVSIISTGALLLLNSNTETKTYLAGKMILIVGLIASVPASCLITMTALKSDAISKCLVCNRLCG